MRFPFSRAPQPLSRHRKSNRRLLRLESLETRAMLTVAASAGSGYIVFEGDSLTIDASGSSTTAFNGSIVQLDWDLDNDGQFDDLTLLIDDANDPAQFMATLAWSDLVNLNIADSSLFLYTIGVRATDNLGDFDDDFTDIFVVNVDPVLGAATYTQVGGGSGGSGCGDEGGGGGVVEFTATFVDFGVNETYTVAIDWGGAGTAIDAPVITPNGNGSYTVTASYAYDAAGAYSATWSASDGEGAPVESSPESVTVTGGAPSGPSVCFDEATGEVTVTGSTGEDSVFVTMQNGMIRLSASFLTNEDQFVEYPAASVQQIYATLGDGDDVFVVANNVNLPVVVVGGAGNDILSGGPGRSILIGGEGSDVLIGGGGEDILIGGTTDFDNDAAALLAILAEWNSANTLEQRVRNLVDGSGTTGGGANGSVFLTDGPGGTVHDDGQFDWLLGGTGTDWLFLNGTRERLLAFGARQDLIGDDLDALFG